MGGICGILKWRGEVELWEVERMAEEAGYRGVDGFGYWRREGAGLASLRHWQAKESYGEKNPTEEGLIVVTSDARLDNREELIDALEKAGYRAGKENTDEELILRSYQCWGERSGERLLGDFAFAIWDAGKRRLYGARDAMGMRPFYYREEGGRFLFATEIQQILVQPGVPLRINEVAVGAHLAGVFGDLEWTFYEGIRQLPPGHALVVEEGSVRIWRHWEAETGGIRYRREEEYAEHFQELFREAVRCRLRSERRVGISLSGGMDSGSVASMAGWLRAQGEAPCRELRAYCWAFRELKECDEREISDQIVRHYGIALTEVDAEEAWPLKGYPEHGPHRDEPFFGVYQALLEKTLATARDNGTSLLLTGDGGDELVGAWVYDPIGLALRGSLRPAWRETRPYLRTAGFRSRRQFLMTVLPRLLHRNGLAFAGQTRSCPSWIHRDFARRTGLLDLIANDQKNRLQSPVEQRKAILLSPALGRWLRWLERSYARFSIQFSAPWTDRRLVQFILSIPQWVVHQSTEPKRLVRQSMRDIMPETTRLEAGKREPDRLFQLGMKIHGRVTIERLVSTASAGIRGYVDKKILLEDYRQYLAGRMPRHDLWAPLTLEMWLRAFWRGKPGRTRVVEENLLPLTTSSVIAPGEVCVDEPLTRRNG